MRVRTRPTRSISIPEKTPPSAETTRVTVVSSPACPLEMWKYAAMATMPSGSTWKS
jgi:hypothetical protein